MKAELISRIGEGVPFGRWRRCRYPVESALETKKVVDQAVVKMKTSRASTRTCLGPSFEPPDTRGEEGSVAGVDLSRGFAIASMLTARKCDSRYVRSGRAPGGGEQRGSDFVGGVERWLIVNL